MTCDVLIVGGGLVGTSLACALDNLGLKTTLVEATTPRVAAPPSFDERNLALARASMNALQALGVWKHLATPPAPIRHIHVSSRGDFGSVKLDAADRGLEAFGATVVARELGAALEARVAELVNLSHLRPAKVISVETTSEAVRAHVQTAEGDTTVLARLVVAADGTESSVRQMLGIGTEVHDYEQVLFVSVATANKTPPHTAYERFTPEGPVALLPLQGGRLGTVCTLNKEAADAALALDDTGYLALLQERFGWRVGKFQRVGKRSAYPLRKVVATRLSATRAVLVGNAAQTLHPIGAQGFNLGLRDALTLAEVIAEAMKSGADIGEDAVIARHVSRRTQDREATLAMSDGLARVFSNSFAPLRIARSLGVVAMGQIPGLVDGIVTDAMGFGGDVPALALENK